MSHVFAQSRGGNKAPRASRVAAIARRNRNPAHGAAKVLGIVGQVGAATMMVFSIAPCPMLRSQQRATCREAQINCSASKVR